MQVLWLCQGTSCLAGTAKPGMPCANAPLALQATKHCAYWQMEARSVWGLTAVAVAKCKERIVHVDNRKGQWSW